ncbi:M23 family metallopeptidase [Sphingomonas sp. AR_OL41]|uniref:M23 family metallopeptidase n=1 Tax=Sphingomonas sp. AR_OL41 TaxID=3042729 RepID=UPI00248009FD|nr:M23 family metallopeptidase [Sphingomonas sp. AR_OL41]MDH7973335.1 M23 family metallopeptidase [Sphingomonas sp. AR_OL41]
MSYTLTQDYGVRWSDNASQLHTGLDLAAPKGAAVYAVKSGQITKQGSLGYSKVSGENWGNYIVINNDDGTASGYLHVEPTKSFVNNRVNAGDQIAVVYKNHLHLNYCPSVTGCQHGAFPNDTFPTSSYKATTTDLARFYYRPKIG